MFNAIVNNNNNKSLFTEGYPFSKIQANLVLIEMLGPDVQCNCK